MAKVIFSINGYVTFNFAPTDEIYKKIVRKEELETIENDRMLSDDEWIEMCNLEDEIVKYVHEELIKREVDTDNAYVLEVKPG